MVAKISDVAEVQGGIVLSRTEKSPKTKKTTAAHLKMQCSCGLSQNMQIHQEGSGNKSLYSFLNTKKRCPR